jgi:hypothetical protein
MSGCGSRVPEELRQAGLAGAAVLKVTSLTPRAITELDARTDSLAITTRVCD